LSHVLLFPLFPWGFWNNLCFGAAINDSGHAVAKPPPDFLPRFRTALILHSVMQQSRDGLILVPAMFEHNAGNCQKMGNIWNRRALSMLRSVELTRKNQRLLKPP
jgi:hypothetical protein